MLVEVLLWVEGTGLPGGGHVFLSGDKCIRVSFWGSGFLFFKVAGLLSASLHLTLRALQSTFKFDRSVTTDACPAPFRSCRARSNLSRRFSRG